MQAVPDLLRARAVLPPGAGADAFFALFDVREERARCVAPPQLAAKYGASCCPAWLVVGALFA